jgi:predicted nucleic acid-binding Zn ribbon protein
MTRTCDHCGTSYEARRDDQRFCSAACRRAGFTAGQDQKRRERDATVRLLLLTASQAIAEARTLLSEERQ